jgi:hypothetical protein
VIGEVSGRSSLLGSDCYLSLPETIVVDCFELREALLVSCRLGHAGPLNMFDHLQLFILTLMYFNADVYGIDLDSQTRCAHYNSLLDILQLRWGM